MRKWLAGIVFALGAAAALQAEDFWEKKKFTEWTDKEARQMMTNSPWARRVDVPLGMRAGGSGRGERGGLGVGGGGFPGGGGGGIGEGGPGEGGGGGGAVGPSAGRSQETTSVPTIPILIRWRSALPVKQAAVRTQFGAEAGSSQEAAKMLERQEQLYIVSIGGLPARMLQGTTPDRLKSAAMLKIGKLEPLRPVEVRVNPGEGAAEILLGFPRGQDGAHVITLEDKEVEVVAPMGPLEVRRKFRLKDMVFAGKLEL